MLCILYVVYWVLYEIVKEVLGDKELRVIVYELIKIVKDNMSVDWFKWDSVKVKMRV